MVIDWKKVLVGLGVMNLLGLNSVIGYHIYKQSMTTYDLMTTNDKPVYVDQCGVECQKYIDTQLGKVPKPTVVPTPSPQIVYQTVTAPKIKTRSVTYLTISGSGSTTANDWANITGTDFYFNPSDYPGLIEVYFESSMSLFNGNGMAYVRLYDVTHGTGVQGSEVQTKNQTSTLVTSGKVSFWAGKNLIRVQAKSLTADTAVFASGRLRIVTEN